MLCCQKHGAHSWMTFWGFCLTETKEKGCDESHVCVCTHTNCYSCSQSKVPYVYAWQPWEGGFGTGVFEVFTLHIRVKSWYRNRQREVVLDCRVHQCRFSSDSWHEYAITPDKTQEEPTVSDTEVWPILSFHSNSNLIKSQCIIIPWFTAWCKDIYAETDW